MWLVTMAMAIAGTPDPTMITAADGWTFDSELQQEELGTIRLYTRTIADVPCYRVRTVTGVPVDTLLATVTDVRSVPRWSSNGVTESKVLGDEGGAIDYVQYLDIPGWTMASDRFWFIRGRVERGARGAAMWRWEKLDAGGRHADFYSDFLARHADAVEVPINSGAWSFQPTANGQTELWYSVCTDSGGSLPSALKATASRRTMPLAVADLVREAKRRAAATPAASR